MYKKGSTGKIVYDIHNSLVNRKIDSVVCYGRGEKFNEPNVYKVCNEYYAKFNNVLSRINGLLYGGCFFSTLKLISIIKKENPDIVHLHCINGHFVNIYKLVSWLKQNKINTVVTLHAEFMHTANCSHAFECDKWKTGCKNCPNLKSATGSLFFDRTATSYNKMKNAFANFEKSVIVSVSPWLMERAKQSAILYDKKHCVVFNGLNTNVFHICNNAELKNKLAPNKEKIIFYATPEFNADKNHIKGGYYVLELARRLKNCKFIVAGPHSEIMDLPENVTFLGMVKDQKMLAEYYCAADVTLITSKRETFSMICAESLCCGTPVVGFKAGGPETVSIDEFCRFCEYGNVSELENLIKDALSFEKSDNISNQAMKIYSSDNMINEYLKIYENMLEE